MTTCWNILIQEAKERYNDTSPVVYCTLTEEELNTEFNNGFGSSEGKPFTLWTEQRVYFPWVYDGLEGVASVPRDPCDEATPHVGGE